MGLRLKGSMKVSHFILEVDLSFKNTGEVDWFINWAERIRRFHSPVREGS